MSIFEELNTLIEGLDVPVETGVFSDKPPVTYAVLTPLIDSFECYADNKPQFDVCEVRISLFTKANYLSLTDRLVRALLAEGFTITLRKYIGREDNTGYNHYAIDVAKEYIFQEEE